MTKKDGTVVSTTVTPNNLLTYLKSSAGGNGDYVLTVNATKTDNNMTPSTATNSTVINFTINSATPAVVDINMVEPVGTFKDPIKNPDLVDTYYQATPS